MTEPPPLKVLVVDDHADFRRTVRQMCQSAGVIITEASSGEDAVERYVAERPDWVVMDLRMPGMGGIKAIQAIRRLDSHAQIIAISQFNEPEYQEEARGAGAVAFLDKEDTSRLVEILQCRTRPS